MRTELKPEKKTKLLMLLGGLALVLVIAAFAAFKINSNARAYELERQKEQEAQQEYEEERLADLEMQQVEEAKLEAEEAAEEAAERLGFIDGVTYDTGLTPEPTQQQVMDVMHKMTHQKVRAEKKIGAIPMVEDTINQVYDIVSNSQFANKDKMLEIADKWKNGWFDTIDSDHNFFWEQKEGTIGKAYGVLSSAEEKEYIKVTFPELVQE
ncbi:DUF6241 domain-containing protein [Mesobacillus foraminis]|uniref:Uncharacterized protein n=1 Tax=Mesobacillus foraminis TaxID=279826 RepID=A0A4V2RDB3_9BACI|nr:DUF6241 domain-containing protein [Mesobacillus foraminis]TCN24150.1 hypothetical protein EV146_108264 [Mesobacillus foraminis]